MFIIPEYGENITTAQLGRLFEKMGQALQQWPMSVINTANEYALEGLKVVESRFTDALTAFQDYEKRLAEMEEEAYQKSEETYNKIRDSRSALREKLEDLPKVEMPKNLNLYELKSFLEIADKLVAMSPNAWNRLVRIMELYNARPDDVVKE